MAMVSSFSTKMAFSLHPRILLSTFHTHSSSSLQLHSAKQCQNPLSATTTKRRTNLSIRAMRTESQTVPLQSRAPYFQLPEPLTGKTWKLNDFEGNSSLLVMFICNHCPFVIHLKEDIVKIANDYIPKGLGVVAISANSVMTHPQDGPEFMAEEAKHFKFPFPYLYDETQEIAKAFGAACTPDFFLYRKDEQNQFCLAYHGQFDDSRPNNSKPITGSDIRAALDCIINGQAVTFPQKPSIGCSIKWHPK